MIAYLIIDGLLLRLYDTVTLFCLTTVAGYFPSSRFTYKSHHNFSVQRTELYVTCNMFASRRKPLATVL